MSVNGKPRPDSRGFGKRRPPNQRLAGVAGNPQRFLSSRAVADAGTVGPASLRRSASGHEKQQNQSEQHDDQAAYADLMRRPFRYFTERVAPGARKNEWEHPLDNQHQRDREQ
ncbi:hypothetical protein J2801_001607 [Paraburkholderia phenoliruptrix]|nr:hypothetical protein [Paraburkholderia phenoliruptrix]